MQTIDPFRWALTGGYRAQDDASTTILERAWASGQGGTAPDRVITDSTIVAGATPTGWSNISVHVAGMGARFRINSTSNKNNNNTNNKVKAAESIKLNYTITTAKTTNYKT